MIVKNIKKLCAENKISISALEKELKLGNGTISKWADCSPSVDKLKKVADYFNCTIDDLLKEEEQ